MQNIQLIQKLVNNYFETRLHIKPGAGYVSEKKRLKALGDEIIDIPAENMDDLQRKVTLALAYLEETDEALYKAEDKEDIFRSVLQDYLYVYARHRLSAADHCYSSSQAPINYYNQIHAAAQKKL